MTSLNTTYDDFDSGIEYNCAERGQWGIQNNNTNFYNGTIHSTSSADCTATFNFSGTGIAIIADRNGDHGLFSVEIDGGEPLVVNGTMPGGGAGPVEILASIQGLSSTTRHTFIARTASQGWMSIDRLVVLHTGSFENGQDGQWTSKFAVTNPSTQAGTNSTTRTSSTSTGASSSDAVSSPTSSALSTASSSSNSANSGTESKSLGTGALAGIAVAAVVLALGIAFLIFWCARKRRRERQRAQAPLSAGTEANLPFRNETYEKSSSPDPTLSATADSRSQVDWLSVPSPELIHASPDILVRTAAGTPKYFPGDEDNSTVVTKSTNSILNRLMSTRYDGPITVGPRSMNSLPAYNSDPSASANNFSTSPASTYPNSRPWEASYVPPVPEVDYEDDVMAPNRSQRTGMNENGLESPEAFTPRR